MSCGQILHLQRCMPQWVSSYGNRNLHNINFMADRYICVCVSLYPPLSYLYMSITIHVCVYVYVCTLMTGRLQCVYICVRYVSISVCESYCVFACIYKHFEGLLVRFSSWYKQQPTSLTPWHLPTPLSPVTLLRHLFL